MSPAPPELADMQGEMIPMAQLSTGEQAHLSIRGLTLKGQREAKQFLADDIEGQLGRRRVEVILHRP